MIAVCRSRRDFRRIETEGRTVRRQLSWARVVHDPSVGECRIAFALGRRLGNAVTRNLLRRRLRAIVRHHRSRLPAGLLLIGVTPPAAAAGFARLEADVAELLTAVGATAASAAERVS